MDITEQITAREDATPGDYPFSVEARAYGPGFNSSYITDEIIPADLMVAGTPLLVTDPVAHGVVVALTPSQATVGQALWIKLPHKPRTSSNSPTQAARTTTTASS